MYLYSIHVEPYERHLKKKPKGLNGKTEIDVDDLQRHAESVQGLEQDLEMLVKALTTQTST